MKIAITSDIYYPMVNGVAVFAHNLAIGLAKKGHKVIVICPSFTGKKHVAKKDGVTIFYTKSVRFPFYPDQINKVPEKKEIAGVQMPRLLYRHGIWASLSPYPELKRALNKFKPDVIHNQTAETIALATRLYAQKYNVPLVTTGHAYPDNITGQFKTLRPIKKPLDAILRSYMASFLKHSEYATMPTEMAINDLIPKDRKHFDVTVEALSNGVDLSAFTPGEAPDRIYKKYKIPRDKPIVLYVGRVDPEKSIQNVIKSFALVVQKLPKAVLVIAGDGIDKMNLETLVMELGLGSAVLFLGKVLPPDLMEIYKVGAVFVTASETETQGIVLIEAAATGLPIVAVDAGAVKDVCHDHENGILCDVGNRKQFANAVVEILTDKKESERFSKNSLNISEKHDLNRTLMRFEEIYHEAIYLKENHE